MPDILPPGNTPAWSPFDNANTIADTWQQEMWPSIWPRLNHKYANNAERDADLAGMSSADAGVLAYTRDTQTLWAWTGSTFQAVWSASSASLQPRASYDAGFRQTSDGAEIVPGTGGSETYRWSRLGGGVNVAVTGLVVRGTGGSVGTSGYAWSLPVTPRDYRMVSGTGYVYDQSTGAEIPCILRGTGGTGVSLMKASGGRVGSDTLTWAIGDTIMWDVVYEGVSS